MKINQRRDRKKFSPLSLWIIDHVRACLYGFGSLVRTPIATLMTIAVISVAIALPAGFSLFLKNFQHLSRPWSGSPSVSLYLKQHTNDATIKKLTDALQQRKEIKSITYISPADGLAELKKAAVFGDALQALDANPLPPVLVITPQKQYEKPQAMQQLLMNLKDMPDVASAELDLNWLKRLHYVISFGKRIVFTLATLFGIGLILIIGNTIRLTTQAHRQEMLILKLVGATNAFIRRPILYQGAGYGLFGGCLAWILVALMLHWLAAPAQQLAATYESNFMLNLLNLKAGISIVGTSVLFGLAGSWLAIRHHLTSPEKL